MEVPPIIVHTTESKEQRTWTLKLHYCDIFHFLFILVLHRSRNTYRSYVITAMEKCRPSPKVA